MKAKPKGSSELPQLPSKLEQIFLDRIKVIGDSEHTYYGYPAELMSAVHAYVDSQKKEAEQLGRDRECYENVQKIEALGASEDLTRAVSAIARGPLQLGADYKSHRGGGNA